MWSKKGLLFNVNDHLEDRTHGCIPFSYHLGGDNYRIFFSARDKGKSIPYYIDSVVSDGEIKLTSKVSDPILALGDLGTFDDSGIMPSSLVELDGKIYMFYIAWNPQVTVSYRLSIGLATSEDGGDTFEKVSQGPLLDRSINEPYFNTAPFVIHDEGIWKMWYVSCTGWEMINDYPEPLYHVKYSESEDGINWSKPGKVCIDYDNIMKSIGRPCVIKKRDKYEMYYSYRDTVNYRKERGKGYQIGKAISDDGVNWTKTVNETGITLSDDGWDSIMMEYCHVFLHNNTEYMIYNGNGFGEDGFGYAIK